LEEQEQELWLLRQKQALALASTNLATLQEALVGQVARVDQRRDERNVVAQSYFGRTMTG